MNDDESTAYATVQDITNLWRSLTTAEQTRAGYLLEAVSDLMRQEAKNVGKDLDDMIEDGDVLESVVKSVCVDIVVRALNTDATAQPQSQFSQSALGYTVSGTYLIPGGGLYIKKGELSRLGLKRQRIGVIDLC